MTKKRSFLFAAALVGSEPLTIGWLFRGPIHVALISPVLLAVICQHFLRGLPFGQQLRWIAGAAGVATGVLTISIALSSPVGLSLLPAPFWFPWLFLFAVTPLLFHRWATRVRLLFRPMIAVGLAAAVYLLSGLLCLEFWTCTDPTDVEHPDAQGRMPALGPGVSPVGRLVCPPQGPSFLWSVDYGGGEWLWAVYRPVIRFWFSLSVTPYFYPYEKTA